MFTSLFPYLRLLFFAVDVILNWFRLFINSVYSLCSFSAHFVFVMKLELVIFNLGVQMFIMYFTLFELSIGIRAGALFVV